MGLIDTEGTYILELLQSGVAESTNGFPQWVPQVKALKKYVDDPAGLAHFKIEEAGYVDWTGYNETLTDYVTLFGAKGPTLSYEQIQKALEWDGDFTTLPSAAGKQFLGRIAQEEYNGKIRYKLAWIDVVDADPNRQVRTLDAEGIKALAAKFGVGGKAKVATAKPVGASGAAPTKPATSTAKPTTGKPVAPSTSKASPAPTTKTSAAKITAPTTDGPPAETTRDDAWTYIQLHKGENDDDSVVDAWSSAVNEVAKDEKHDEENFTPKDWATVRDTIVKDMSLT